jgi:hypothetical protein
MKKIINAVSTFLNNLILNHKAENKTAGNNLQVQPVYSQPAARFLKAVPKCLSLPGIAGIFFLLMITASLSSCFTSGYGCKGNSHCMTRVR